ncbi:hypothetical protein [Alkalicoccus chagannorensis]|uniref:hypothetical protein n=1 Tax=Alkalicoccus chagannorensis TaxID=427072 RepID=UPI00047BCF34|nr:hypothetical protein [Alkalicoccus chagannorensis]
MNEAWMIGPLLVQQAWLYVIAAFAAGFLYLHWVSPVDDKTVREEVFSLFLYALLVLFFGSILTQWNVTMADPLAAAVYPPGTGEIMLAVGVFVVLVFNFQGNTALLLQGTSYVLFVSTAVYAFLAPPAGIQTAGFTHPAGLYIMAVSLFFLVLLHTYKQGAAFLVLWGLSMAAAHQATVVTTFFLTPAADYVYVVISAGALAGYWQQRRKAT